MNVLYPHCPGSLDLLWPALCILTPQATAHPDDQTDGSRYRNRQFEYEKENLFIREGPWVRMPQKYRTREDDQSNSTRCKQADDGADAATEKTIADHRPNRPLALHRHFTNERKNCSLLPELGGPICLCATPGTSSGNQAHTAPRRLVLGLSDSHSRRGCLRCTQPRNFLCRRP